MTFFENSMKQTIFLFALAVVIQGGCVGHDSVEDVSSVEVIENPDSEMMSVYEQRSPQKPFNPERDK